MGLTPATGRVAAALLAKRICATGYLTIVERQFLKTILLAALCGCLSAAQVTAQPVCKPAVSVKQIGFSEMINLRRIWTASIEIDASRCATASGLYSIGFIRQAENAPELGFTEPFIWRLGQKQVVVEFWANEAVERYWVDDVATCPCRSAQATGIP